MKNIRGEHNKDDILNINNYIYSTVGYLVYNHAINF